MSAEYRAVSRLSNGTDEIWTLQIKRKLLGLAWWHSLDKYCYDADRALTKARKHAARKSYEVKVVNFGVLG